MLGARLGVCLQFAKQTCCVEDGQHIHGILQFSLARGAIFGWLFDWVGGDTQCSAVTLTHTRYIDACGIKLANSVFPHTCVLTHSHKPTTTTALPPLQTLTGLS